MEDFPLIHHLNNNETIQSSNLAAGITYQRYEIDINGSPQIVNIPLREAVNFENALGSRNGLITKKVLKMLLREFRGVRESGK